MHLSGRFVAAEARSALGGLALGAAQRLARRVAGLVEREAARVTARVRTGRDVRRREARLLAGPVVAAARDDGAVQLELVGPLARVAADAVAVQVRDVEAVLLARADLRR